MNHYRLKNLVKKQFENGFSYYFALAFIFLIGIVLGAILIKVYENEVKLSLLKYGNAFYYNILNKTFTRVNVFKTAVGYNIVFVLVAFVLGLIKMGFLFLPILILIKGLLLGYTVGYLIFNFGFSGFMVSILGIYPQYLLYIPALISISAISMMMSYNYKLTPSKRVVKVKKFDFMDYTFVNLIFTLILILGSLYEGFVSPNFLNLINVFL